MKKSFLLLLLTILSRQLFAQSEMLQLDENNKYVYYEVVDKPGLPADTLYARAFDYLTKHYMKQANKDAAPNAVTFTGKFLVHSNALITKKETGEINFQLYVEAKDGRYRYKFWNFVFTPYKIDRYGNMVAVPGINIPLENLSGRVPKNDVASYAEQVGTATKAAAIQLKLQMDKAQALKKAEKIKKVNTEKW